MTTVKVGAVPFKVEDAPIVDGDKNILGQTDHTACTITLKDCMSAELRKQTMLHELVHAWLVMISELDLSENEQFVSSLAMAMYESVEVKETPSQDKA